jgi:3-hydroxyisobutyrate dehydrogenase
MSIRREVAAGHSKESMDPNASSAEPASSRRSTIRVGFIGLGQQGAPIAMRIADAGFETTVWARRAASLASFTGKANVSVASSPAALAARSDVVGVCVFGDDDVVEVASGPDGILDSLRPGGLLIVHSTVHPSTATALHETAAHRGIRVLDAPVSGGGAAAATGTLTVMAGGEPDAFQQALPVFSSYASTVVHVGPVGTGSLIKVLNNFLFTAILGLTEEALAFAEDHGASRQMVADVLAHASGASYGLDVLRGFEASLPRLLEIARPPLEKDAAIMDALIAASGGTAGALHAAVTQALRDEV